MNSGATTERVYEAVKRRILAGAYRPGERIDLPGLADALSSSITPVRDALHLMVGERLVENRAGDGFHLQPLDVPALGDLYDWNRHILILALRAPKPAEVSPLSVEAGDAGDQAAQTFIRIARRSDNTELRYEIASVNDRLHAVRNTEATLFDDWAQELATIDGVIDNPSSARRLVQVYHRRRVRHIGEIVRVLLRPLASRHGETFSI